MIFTGLKQDDITYAKTVLCEGILLTGIRDAQNGSS